MEKALTILLAAGVLGLAVFGVFFMPSEMTDHSGGGCLAIFLSGSICPNENPLVLALFHLEVLSGLSLAVFGQETFGGFSIIFLALALIGLVIFRSWLRPSLNLRRSGFRLGDYFSRSSTKKFISWIALHENSPAY